MSDIYCSFFEQEMFFTVKCACLMYWKIMNKISFNRVYSVISVSEAVLYVRLLIIITIVCATLFGRFNNHFHGLDF